MSPAARTGWTLERAPRWTLVQGIVQEFRRRLAGHRRRLLEERDAGRAATGRRVVARGNPTWAAGMRELVRLTPRARRALDEILDAERRIDAGVFGLCQRCHRPISLRRLRTAPTIRLCPRCSKPRS